jgi:micrococcal nuclease
MRANKGKLYFVVTVIVCTVLFAFSIAWVFSYVSRLKIPAISAPSIFNILPSTLSTSSSNLSDKNDTSALVVRVIDGDTIELEDGQHVRYIGMNTPEITDKRKIVQCFSKEASVKNTELVLNKQVRLEKDISETDKYGRLLRYVYIGDIFVNDFLVREGYAHSSSYPPDIKYRDRFRLSEQYARAANIGLWSSCGKNAN